MRVRKAAARRASGVRHCGAERRWRAVAGDRRPIVALILAAALCPHGPGAIEKSLLSEGCAAAEFALESDPAEVVGRDESPSGEVESARLVAEGSVATVRAGTDWLHGTISAVGSASGEAGLPAPRRQEEGLRRARDEGLRAVERSLGEIAFDRRRRVGDLLEETPELAPLVRRTLREGAESEARYLSNGAVEMAVVVALRGELLDLLLPSFAQGAPLATARCPTCGQPWPYRRPLPPDSVLGSWRVEDEDERPTGLGVRVGGAALVPAILPRVVTPGGDEVYGPGFASRDTVLARGLLIYGREEDEEIVRRIGPRPLIIEAIGTAGAQRTDIIISREDARRLHSSLWLRAILHSCRVAALIEEGEGAAPFGGGEGPAPGRGEGE
jgi:hypothetical protein